MYNPENNKYNKNKALPMQFFCCCTQEETTVTPENSAEYVGANQITPVLIDTTKHTITRHHQQVCNNAAQLIQYSNDFVR